MERMVISSFSVSNNVFHPFQKDFLNFVTLSLSSANALSLDQSKISSYVNPFLHNTAGNEQFLLYPQCFLSI